MNVNTIVISGPDYRTVRVCHDSKLVSALYDELCECNRLLGRTQPTFEEVQEMVDLNESFFEFGDTYIDVNYCVEVESADDDDLDDTHGMGYGDEDD